MKLCKSISRNKNNAYKIFISKQNELQAKKFARVPFNKRIVVVPHCMRNTLTCIAIENKGYCTCKECGGCKIGEISKLTKKLNYSALYVLKGGRIIENIIREQKPQAVVGIACFFEGKQGFKLLRNKNLTVQFIPLSKDGCTATDIDLQEVKIILERIDSTK
ncbi:MAG: DUF116 domain-containing protein [Endomicrobium sp.]|jgi:hypothetical protein|nr:DUF116 domain-containing protein [Endomicrobium sp.]